MWNEDTACNITKNEEVIERESGGARLPLVAASTSSSFTAYADMLQRFRQKMLGKNGIKIGEHSAAHS